MSSIKESSLGLNYGWSYGETGWNSGMDENIVLTGFHANKQVKGILSTPPTTGVNNGDAYIVGSSPTGTWVGNYAKVAIYDRGSWLFATPSTGVSVYNKANGCWYEYNNGWSLKPEAEESPYIKVKDFDFSTGYTITDSRQLLFYPTNQTYYQWNGALPKVVAAGSTPATSGGISLTAWVDRTDVTLRSELFSGSLTIRNTIPSLRDIVSVADFGVKGDGSDETTNLQLAINYAAGLGKDLYFPNPETYYGYTFLIVPVQQGGVNWYGDGANSIYNLQNGIYNGTTLKSSITSGNTIRVYGSTYYTNRRVQLHNMSVVGQTSDYVVAFKGSPDNSGLYNVNILNTASGSGVHVKDCWSGFKISDSSIHGSDDTDTGGIGVYLENSILAGGFIAENSSIDNWRKSAHIGEYVYQANFINVGLQSSKHGAYIEGSYSSVNMQRVHFEFNSDIPLYLSKSVNCSFDGLTFYRNAESASGIKADIYVHGGAANYNLGLNIENCREMGQSNDVTFIYIINPSYASGRIVNNHAVKYSDGTGTVGLYCADTNPEYFDVLSNRFESLETPYSGAVNKFKSFSKALDGYQGIRFSSSPAASSNKNTLDWYEEGTWTPVVGGDVTTSGQTYSEQVGHYQRIGNTVYFDFSITLSAVGTVSGNAQVSGLPFTVNSNNVGSGIVSHFTGLGLSVVHLGITPKASSDAFYFRHTTAAASSSTYPASNSLLTSTTRIQGSGRYTV